MGLELTPNLGDKVTVKAVIVRGYMQFGTEHGKGWHRTECRIPLKGVFVGVRTVWDGTSMLIGYDEGYAFCPERHQQSYLVAVNKRSFVHALPGDVELLEVPHE